MDKESYYNNSNLKKFLLMLINYIVNKIKYCKDWCQNRVVIGVVNTNNPEVSG